MWEQIKANKRNSVILLFSMAVVLVLLGFVIGLSVGGPNGGLIGIFSATVVWLVLMLISFFGGDQILLASCKAIPVTPEVHQQLFNVVEEMTIAANLHRMPKVYIINDPAPNAFATGRNPQNASVAVTAGLLARLNRDELQGVIAHEVSHITHRDILFVTLAGVMLGSIVLISEIFLRGILRGSAGSRRYSSRSSGGGYAQLIIIVAALIAAILAPIMAQILYFALSRRREYLADAGGARLTRYPEGLASALEKISAADIEMESANKVTAPMYIVNPLRGLKAASLFSTHPPVEERIRILRNMSHGAAFTDYEKSYEQITKKQKIIPPSAMKPEEVAIRQVPAGSYPLPTSKQQRRDFGDIMRKVNQFAFVRCPCGLTMKIPPNFKSGSVACPRCGQISPIDKNLTV